MTHPIVAERADHIAAYVVDVLKTTAGLLAVLVGVKLLEPVYTDDASANDLAKSFLYQAAKWHDVSSQSKNAVYSFQHANYAIAYLNAARHVADDKSLERLSGTDIHHLYKELDGQQKAAFKEMAKACPKSKLRLNALASSWL